MVHTDAEDVNTLYFSEKDREKSYLAWPFSNEQPCNIKRMAEAGFYWCGNMDKDRDTVCCFLCGKLLDGWESTDDPWSEHRQHAPQCHFVKLGRPEKDLTIGELLDLMEKFLEKFRYSLLEKAKSKVAEKIREMRGNCRAI